MTRSRVKADIERLKRAVERLIEFRRRKDADPRLKGRKQIKDGREGVRVS
jgi:hypothetical protein